jgi:fatty-acyl-CoA synthase
VARAYDHAASPVELRRETIGECLAQTISRWPDQMALISSHQGIRYTWAELDAAVDEVARALVGTHDLGDRVGLLAPNRAEWTVVEYACARLGLVLVNLNPAYRRDELRFTLAKAGVRTVISAPSFRTSDYRSMLDSMPRELSSLERVVYFDDPSWDDLRASAAATDRSVVEARMRAFDLDHPFSIMFTSGTTGSPKGATVSHHNALNNGSSIADRLSYTEEDRLCLPLPLYHTFGAVVGNLGCASHGSAVVLPAEAFDPAATLDAIERERCTSIYGVPTMFIAMLEDVDLADRDLSSLRTGAMGGSPCPISVMQRVGQDLNLGQISIVYGMTETTVTTQTRPDDPVERRVESVGRALPHIELKVVDPVTGQTVERNEPGELCARGYTVMLGYWDDDERTRESIDSARWMHTGDLATMDDEGYINIVGRIKDMVIRGGVNLYPREIEEFLHTHPQILDVQVVGVPDVRYGEELMAWVKRRPGGDLTAEGLREFCKERIAHFKIPTYVEFVDEFPLTVTGKVQKYVLRELGIERLGLQEAAAVATA